MQTVLIHLADNGTLVVTLRGEVDYSQAPPIAASVPEAVVTHRPAAVCIGLAEVTFLDSSGISVLIQARNAAKQMDARFAVERPIHAAFISKHGGPGGTVRPESVIGRFDREELRRRSDTGAG